MTAIIRIILLTMALTACSSQQAAHTDPTGGPMSDTDAVITRFTDDIWPAVEGYRAPGQGSPQSQRWWGIVDKTLPDDAANAVRAAGFHLGKVGDATMPRRSPDGPLRLANATVTALNDSTATVIACYTYTASDRDGANPAATASEATFELHKTDNWYLRAITDDHVVPGCPSSQD